jgi:integrase
VAKQRTRLRRGRQGPRAGDGRKDTDSASESRSGEDERQVDVVVPVHSELATYLERAMEASSSEFVCPGDVETGAQMPKHFDLEGRLRRTMAEAGVGITGFVHHCGAWHCKSVVRAADDKPRAFERHRLEQMLVRREVRPLGFHDLRRSHVSLLAHAGVSTAVTQKLMRHSDPKLTERIYTVVDVGARWAVSTSKGFLPRSYRTGQKLHRRPGLREQRGKKRPANAAAWRQ